MNHINVIKPSSWPEVFFIYGLFLQKQAKCAYFLWNCQEMHQWPLTLRATSDHVQLRWEFLKSIKDLHSPCCLHPTHYHSIGITFYHLSHMVSLKLFLRLPVVLSSSPLKILEGFCRGIHSNRILVIRNDLICFIEEGLFCLYNGRKTDRIWNCIFQRRQS